MSAVIQLLSDAIANQIAAGEVVQRPASVVKELLENAIDAGADDITLVLKKAGKMLIQVVDNGSGMFETDARLCFERHATSKIKKADDLFALHTMGFRGEALASIAAIAQVELKTRREEDEAGTRIVIEGSQLLTQEPEATPRGTNLMVKNLFYNVPARRKFLKSDNVEMRHIVDEFQRVALANPQAGFTLIHNDNELYRLKATDKLSVRLVAMLGNDLRKNLVACQEETPLLSIKGYVGKPEMAKKTRGDQFFFVNNRFIKSGFLHHAVVSAYEGLLSDGTHPFYALYIVIDPSSIDVNIHPTKTEIKFENEQIVYRIIHAAVRKALSSHHLVPSIDFESSNTFNQTTDNSSANEGGKPINILSRINQPEAGQEKEPYQPEENPDDKRKKSNLKNWEKLFTPSQEQDREDLTHSFENDTRIPYKDLDDSEADSSSLSPQTPVDYTPESPKVITISSSLHQVTQPTPSQQAGWQQGQTVIQIQNYLVAQMRTGMLLVDRQAARERILYEQFLTSLTKNSAFSQKLMFPEVVHLNVADMMLLEEMQNEVKATGLDFDIIDRHAISITGLPPESGQILPKDLIEDFIEQFKNGALAPGTIHERLAMAMAGRVSCRHPSSPDQ